MRTKKTDRQGALWGVIVKTIKKYKLLTIALFVALSGAVVLILIPPLVLEKIVNELVGQKSITMHLALLYFGILVLSGLFDAGKEILITLFGQKITHGLRSKMCEKLSMLPAAYFTAHEPGMITSRFVNDVDTVEALFANGIISMCVDICKVISIITVIFIKSPGLGLLLVIVAPLLYGLTRTFQKRMLVAQKANRVAIGNVNKYIPETIENIRTIHCLVKESYMEQQYDKKIQASYHAVEKSNLYDSIYSPIIIIISTGLIAVLMILSAMGGQMQDFFGMSVGTAVAVIAYVGKVFAPLESIGMEIQNIQSAVAGVNRINELLLEEEQEETDESITFETLMQGKEEGIRFENVTFSYEKEQKVIENLSFFIASGEMVTLAGRTGVGKSTLFKLFLGLYTPQQGKIMIFGKEAGKIPHKEKRKLFGYVAQSFHRVPGNIAEQISLYEEDVTREEIEKAAKLVGLHESIMALPQGYETNCSSSIFSQGQLQLLSIARAVVKNPPIMLLDEMTANLDSLTEQKVLRALERAAEGRTVISISHRLYENMGSRLITIK